MKESISTYPNQKIIHINKNQFVGDYLSIENDDWIEASKMLSPNTFKVYLYFASNANGFDLILSRQAVMNRLDMSADSYKRAIKELGTKKYIVEKQGNIYDFFTVPMGAEMQPSDETMVAKMPPYMGQNCTQYGSKNAPIMGAEMPPEISNKSNINNLSKRENANAKKESYNRVLEDLSDEELKSIKTDDINKVKYRDTQKRLNLSCDVTKDTWKEAENILAQREKKHKSDQNKSVLSKFGLTISEGDELAKKLTDCSWSAWGDCAEGNLNNYLAASNMTAQELLSYLRNNKLATRQIYDEYIPKSIWDSKEKFYHYYEDYLKDYVRNTDDVVCFVEDKMSEKNLYGII